jgi:hypothetical protein
MSHTVTPHTINWILLVMWSVNALTIVSSAYVIVTMRRVRKRMRELQKDLNGLEARVRAK